ncbi:MAG: SGNH/GDSL hydrolase family protein [Clostridia bacterium]|nr:SGNH/GDSL hydrolase family protein [Clostridia bacterium]
MDNSLAGKYISFNGDSICQGTGCPGGYALIIENECSIRTQNIGVGGATVTFGVPGLYGKSRHYISDTIDKMDAEADYAIIEGGANDAGHGVPLGQLSEGFDAELDEETFYGAFELMLKRLIIRFAGKKYGYIASHQTSKGFSVTTPPEKSYYWAARRCCEKWGVPFLDLNSTVPPFIFFKPGSELYPLREKYTYNADGIHPNEEGYRKYYVPKIVAWLKTL